MIVASVALLLVVILSGDGWFPSLGSRLASAAPFPFPDGPISSSEEMDELASYLSRYGFLPPSSPASSSTKAAAVNPADLQSAIIRLQRFGGLEGTGRLDGPTRALLLRPRCGNSDDPPTSEKTAGKWKNNSVTYHFVSYTSKLPQDVQESVYARAFGLWGAVTPLTFQQITTKANIEILFAAGDHGDGYPFDGPGKVLAHTFLPTDGRMHLDDAEPWMSGTANGTDLNWVVVHELGHAIGLHHSNSSTAIMYPYLPKCCPTTKLSDDDINAIQTIYGAPSRVAAPNSEESNPGVRVSSNSNNHDNGAIYRKQDPTFESRMADDFFAAEDSPIDLDADQPGEAEANILTID